MVFKFRYIKDKKNNNKNRKVHMMDKLKNNAYDILDHIFHIYTY